MLLIFLAVSVFSTQAFDLRDALADVPELEKCMPNFQMFDASGKLPNGILPGNMLDLGFFDQCLQIENTTIPLKGQYCLVKLFFHTKQLEQIISSGFKEVTKPPDVEDERLDEDTFIGIILGWCLPHTCPIYELTDALSTKLTQSYPDSIVLPVYDAMCQTKDDLVNKYDASKILLITFLVATLFLMILSTLYDLYLKYSNKKPTYIILIAFSVRSNGEKLLSTSNTADQLGCLNGIRFLSMMWLILVHRFSTFVTEPNLNINVIEMFEWLFRPDHMYVLNSPVTVDTFLVLSGLLIGYTYCLAKEKGVKFNIFLFYVHRYLRLTPVLAVIVWAHASILDVFGSGPFWPFGVKMFKTPCVHNWWATLIYVQNYYHYGEICVSQTWYLAIDMQLYFLSPIILIPLWKWPKWTIIASAILVLLSMVITFAVSYALHLPAFILNAAFRVNSGYFMSHYYLATQTRYGPWLMGLMLGYFLFKVKINKNNGISLHPTYVAVGWIVSMVLLLSTLFSAHNLLLFPDILGNSFFNSLHRHGWALGLCWVIYACTQGYGGPVNTFLCWSLFQILSRFTYTIYLVHLTMQYLLICSSRTVTYFSDFKIMYIFWGDFMLSLAIAVCLTLAYESPMLTLEKVIFKTGHKPKKPEPELPSQNQPGNAQTKVETD